MIDVGAVRDFLTTRAGAAVVRDPVYALDNSAADAAVVTQRWQHGRVRRSGPRCRREHVGPGRAGRDLHALGSPTTSDSPSVEGDGRQSWIDKPVDGVGTYQHQSGPGQWAIGGHVDPSLTAWEAGPEAAIEASRAALIDYARTRLSVEPTIVDGIYCTTVPNLGGAIVKTCG